MIQGIYLLPSEIINKMLIPRPLKGPSIPHHPRTRDQDSTNTKIRTGQDLGLKATAHVDATHREPDHVKNRTKKAACRWAQGKRGKWPCTLKTPRGWPNGPTIVRGTYSCWMVPGGVPCVTAWRLTKTLRWLLSNSRFCDWKSHRSTWSGRKEII